MRRLNFLAVIIAAAVSIAACGDSNPSSPSDANANAVTINGNVVAPGGTQTSASAQTSSTAATAPAGLRVTVVGSNISAIVDASGHFSLKNVPPGNVNLQFSTSTNTALIVLTDLQTGQTVTISVTLSGSSATVESDRRASGKEVQLEGRVESLPPTTAAGSFIVAGQLVTTNDATRFYLGGAASAFTALALGQRVHVKGQTSGTSLLASTVDIQNTNTDVGLNINGIVAGFSGPQSAFQFTVDGRLVKGDASTEFFGNSHFADLANGRRVEVKGSQRDGFVYATRIHVN
jgi:Domain of unknown function (DUF5666)